MSENILNANVASRDWSIDRSIDRETVPMGGVRGGERAGLNFQFAQFASARINKREARSFLANLAPEVYLCRISLLSLSNVANNVDTPVYRYLIRYFQTFKITRSRTPRSETKEEVVLTFMTSSSFLRGKANILANRTQLRSQYECQMYAPCKIQYLISRRFDHCPILFLDRTKCSMLLESTKLTTFLRALNWFWEKKFKRKD